MKRTLFVIIANLVVLASFAQLNGDGYYRVKNVASGRYITVRDNRGSVNIGTTSADMGAVELYRGFDLVASDPSSILYIDNVGDGNYKFHAQGTDTYEIIGYYLKLKQNSDGSFKAYQGNSMMLMYLGDGETSSVVDSRLVTNAKGQYRDWYILPVKSSSNDNYFGVKPEVNAKGVYYASFYASFPFNVVSTGMKVFYISKVVDGMAVYKELNNGVVPAGLPVVVQCSSDSPSANRLNIAANDASSITDNQLSGVYFCNRSTSHRNVTAYNSETMRVLGTAPDGSLAYVKANLDYLPANRSYLKVPAGSPDVIKVVSEEEYQKILDQKTYVVTFKIGNEIISQQTLKAGETIQIPEAPVKEGYTFNGWGNVPSAMPAKDLTIEGAYTINYYSLTFKIGEEIVATETLAFGSTIQAPDAPSKEGYTFGWGNVPPTMPAKDLIIEGSYTLNYYTITFVVDGEVVSTQSVAYGSAIKAPKVSEKKGYTFNGWSDIPATMPAKDLTIEGSYTINNYTITFTLDGEVISSQSLAYGSPINAPEVPDKEGYSFSGWGDIPATMPAKDLVLEGTYLVNYYTIIFKIDGEVISSQSLAYNSPIEIPEVPEKEGYTFGGWDAVPDSMPAKNLTFEGVYTINNYTVTFTLDGEVIFSQSLAYGSPIEIPEVSEKEGYTFSGWGDVPSTMPAKNLTFVGMYIPKDYYVITFKVDNEVILMQSLEEGDTITIPDAPTKEGHTFASWGDVPVTMPAENLTFEGIYTVNNYMVTFKIGSTVVSSVDMPYGSSIVPPEAEEKEGHTFAGWNSLLATVPAYNVTFYGRYIVNTYTLLYVVDGKEYQRRTMEYGAEISLIAAPEKEGYTFSGWSEAPKTMPANDVTVTGSFTVNVHNVYYYVGDELVHTDEVAYGEPIPSYEYVPTTEGETFLGWLGETHATMPDYDLTYTANIESGIDAVVGDSNVDIYTVTGVKVMSNVVLEEVKSLLKRGIYIINGRKMIIE